MQRPRASVLSVVFLMVTLKMRRFRGVRFSSDRRIIHSAISQFGNRRRRYLEAIIRTVTANIVLNYAMRRHDLRRGIYDILETEEIRVRR